LVGWAVLGTATTAGKRLKRSRWLIYKVTTEADVMKLVAAEAPKRGGGGGRGAYSSPFGWHLLRSGAERVSSRRNGGKATQEGRREPSIRPQSTQMS